MLPLQPAVVLNSQRCCIPPHHTPAGAPEAYHVMVTAKKHIVQPIQQYLFI